MPKSHFKLFLILNGQSKKGIFEDNLYGFQSPLLSLDPNLVSSIILS